MLLSLVVACFTLSGFAALLYQTAWMRLFAVAFGTSEVAVAVVLAGYMGGLALGAAVAARYVDSVRRPLLVYGFFEAAIALAALAMPWLVDASGNIYAHFAGGQTVPPDAGTFGQLWYYSVASFLILLVPTGLMGATLPLLARYAVTSNRKLGRRISMLYAMNTLGAVAGTLVAGFILLPALGLKGTVQVGALTNIVVFVIAVIAARRAAAAGQSAQADIAVATNENVTVGVNFVLPLIALSGLLSFVYEILWTRMLSHVLGSSVYAFATMLSAFLTGIAIGAAVAGPFATNPRRAALLFAACQFGVATCSAIVYWQLEQSLPSGIEYAVFAFAVILPSSIFIGATYPLAVRAHSGGVAGIGRSAAVVYSWNTVGAVLGALIGGFIIVPKLGFAGTVKFAVTANIAIGVAVLVFAAMVKTWRPVGQLRMALTTLAMLLVAVLFQPGRPDGLVNQTFFGGSGEAVLREVFFAVGRSSTVLLTENAARFDLSSNGLPEAQIEFKGAPPMILSQRWLGLWPSVFRPAAESMLVVGLGGGVVLEGVPDRIETLHVVELEAEIVEANRMIAERRSIDPLARQQLQLVQNDARNALRLVARKYDAVVSQPSHPWTAGASHLFTREFFALVKSRLTDHGIFVQWMNAEFLDESLLRQLLATLRAEFDYVRVYQPSALALHFIASNSPLDESVFVATSHYSDNGINGRADLVAALLLDERGVAVLAGVSAPVTDDDNRMAMDSNVHAAGLGNEALAKIIAEVDPVLIPGSPARQYLSDSELLYVASRLLWSGQEIRAEQLTASVAGEALHKLLQAMLLQYQGRKSQAQDLLDGFAPGEPFYDTARYLLLADQAPVASHCDKSELAVVLTGWCLLADGNWTQLAALELRLQEIVATDLRAAHASWLRAEWRLQAHDPEGRLVNEALQLIDRALVLAPMPVLYAQRARAARKLDLVSHYAESAAFLARAINDRLWTLDYRGQYLSGEEFRWVTAQLSDIATELQRQQSLDNSGRIAIVSEQVSSLQEYLAGY